MLYVVNVEACIHQENYGIFFYEPAAKQKIELFEAKWTFESLTDVFSQIAAHINRREFEDNDYQVIVCVRKHKRASRHQMNAQLQWLHPQLRVHQMQMHNTNFHPHTDPNPD